MNLPKPEEIQELANKLRVTDFARLLVLTDAVGRFMEVNFSESINTTTFNALLFIATRGGSLPVGRLADLMLRSSNNCTWIVDRMEDEGLVVRLREPRGGDRRVVRVAITTAGAAYLSKAIEVLEQAQEDVMSGFTPEEHEMLKHLVYKINDRMSKGKAKPPELETEADYE